MTIGKEKKTNDQSKPQEMSHIEVRVIAFLNKCCGENIFCEAFARGSCSGNGTICPTLHSEK